MPRRSAVESRGQRRSAPMITSSAKASLSRRAVRQMVSPSGIGTNSHAGDASRDLGILHDIPSCFGEAIGINRLRAASHSRTPAVESDAH